MTRKQFKEGLLRGQGRCIQAAQAEPELYYDLVLWACSHQLAFDAQCEGTRGGYAYQLINCFQDKAPFLEKAARSLEHAKSDGSWKICYLAELLYNFAREGNPAATFALWRKYETLYADLYGRMRRPSGLFHVRDDFDMLCRILGKDRDSFVKIAEDIGRLYRVKSFYDMYDFDCLYDCKWKYCLSILKKQGKQSDDIAEFLRMGESCRRECAERRNQRTVNRPKKGIALSVWLKRKASQDTVLSYAREYREQSVPEARAEALTAFCRCSYPENPLPVLEDAQSNHERLKAAGWSALANIRYPLVREFALDYLQRDMERALPVLIKNYHKQDAALLERFVKSLPVDFEDASGWHGIYLMVLRMEEEGLKPPIALLYYIYETTFCSVCRRLGNEED